MIIDAHNHLGFRHDLGMSDTDLLRRMDRAGVDMAVCFPQPKAWDDAEANEYVYEKAKAHPDRIIQFAGLNPWKKNARDELRRLLDRGARGLKLHPVRDSYSLADHHLVDPLFEECQQRKVPVLSHGMSEWSNTPWQFNKMCQRFPGVTLIMAHGGHNWLRDDAIDVAKRNQNLVLESSVMYSDYIRRVVEQVSPERMLMGTDTPIEAFESEIGKIKTAIRDENQRALVMGGNIARILDIKG